MPRVELDKASILFYEGEREDFLRNLQEKEIIHISDSRSSNLVEDYPDLIPEKEYLDEKGNELLEQVRRVVALLSPHADSKGILGQFIELKTSISPERYKKIIEEFDPKELKGLVVCENRKFHLKNLRNELKEKIAFYGEWKDLDVPLSKFEELKNVQIKLYRVKEDMEEVEKKFEDISIDFSPVFKEKGITGIVFFIHRDFERDFNKLISELDAEVVNFRERDRSPEQIIIDSREKLEDVNKQLKNINEKIERESSEYEKFLVLYDYLLTRVRRTEVLNKGLTTRDVFYLEGWVEKEKRKDLEDIVDEREGVEMRWVEPAEDESPPVKLENNKLTEPYEALTGLYAYPKSGEVDPTPYMAIFFAVFFGFCLTDAVYGIALVAISFLLMPRLPEGRKYLWIFVVGGILTVIAGALTGGWFGNNIEQAFPSLSFMATIRNKFMIFDPFENPLNFLKLSLVFGAIQIGFGLFISLKERIRRGNYLDAVANEISWFVFFIVAVIFYITGNNILKYILPLPLLVVLLFSWRSNSWIKQIAKGAFRLFRTLVGFLGDILSYSRIMALGLVTAGLAMSVNVLVMILKDLVPGVGIILAVFVFLGGHLFSLAINTLSGFVHTMRLQFAEFFSYFYEGGGEKFEPFGRVSEYTRIETQKKEV